MANVEPPHPESPISPAISDIEDPTTPPILARLRELSRSLDEVDIISDEEASNEMLAQYKPRNARDETVRILRSFIDNLPVKGKRMLTKYINVSNDDNLFDLAHHLQTTILIPFRAQGGKTPQVTASPLSATDITRDNMASGMTQSSTRNLLEWLKNICLERDNYQCIVTKLWDPVAVNPQEQCKMTGNTQLAHIIPFSMGHWGNDQKVSFCP